MFQLKFNNDFNSITRDIPYWKNKEAIPKHIKKFIEDTSNKRVIYEKSSNKFYCSRCTEELDSNNYCKKCDIKYKKYTQKDIENYSIDIKIVDKKMASERYCLDNTCNYFVFDILDKNVYLYLIKENITYYNPLSLIPYKSSEIYVDYASSYYIEKDGVTNLQNNIFTSFKELDNYSKALEMNEFNTETEEDFKMFDIFEEFELDTYNAYIYTENLSKLKNTIYKYSKIWELDTYLKENHEFIISQFTLNPLYYPQFEYLINYKLYNLAWNVPNLFKSGKNFKEIFGVDKKYLFFMKTNNITYQELKILQAYPTTDIEILRFFSNYFWDIQLLKNIKIDLKKLKDYLTNNGMSSSYISDYLDYINMAKELRLNLEDKNILYPNNLIEAHDELYNQIEVINDPVIDKKIKNLSSLLNLNRYEDNNYIIYPVTSIEDLVEESRQQKNCVRTYCERVSNNKSQIYLMRKKTDLKKSLVTIEVRDRHIVQARVKYNKLPSSELNEILNKWEQNLIPILNK